MQRINQWQIQANQLNTCYSIRSLTAMRSSYVPAPRVERLPVGTVVLASDSRLDGQPDEQPAKVEQFSGTKQHINNQKWVPCPGAHRGGVAE